MTERCDTCRLWRRLTDAAGECHALPPAPVVYGPGIADCPAGGLVVAWPRTAPEAFCGEWCPLPFTPPAREGGTP